VGTADGAGPKRAARVLRPEDRAPAVLERRLPELLVDAEVRPVTEQGAALDDGHASALCGAVAVPRWAAWARVRRRGEKVV
jgi:hypothetical protein